ncbi:hypothetical protein IWW50_001326 [Coemansia erecta]|nr:hypothetical protein IWW50_001326 [Coemansia erecta]
MYLLLIDPTTHDYVLAELHDSRVRCVFDGMESRGIVYRAKRMQSKLEHYLRVDRARYIRVYRARMNALFATKAFNAIDMQVIRGHLAMLESAVENAGDPVTAGAVADDGEAVGARSVVDNGVLRRRATTAGEVERALACLAARFALPEGFAGSREFRDVCAALFMAQRDGVIARPFAIGSTGDYAVAVDRELRTMQRGVCARLLDATGYSVLLDGWQAAGRGLVVISVSVVVAGAGDPCTFDWVVVEDSGDAGVYAAERVTAVLRELERVFNEASMERRGRAVQMPPLVAVVSGGRVPLVSVVRRLVARSVGGCYDMDCAAHTLGSLAGALLAPAGDGADPGGRVAQCSASLVAVARAVANDATAHGRWIERTGARIALPRADAPAAAHSLLALFQQMVSVDYEFLLELKDIVLGGPADAVDIAAHFDAMLDRSNAPMFLALVQALTLLDCCARVARAPLFALPDLAVVLARLERTLESASQLSDDMQLVAHCVLARLRQTASGEDHVYMCMVLAHSLSLYPSDGCVRASYVDPLSATRVLLFANNTVWSRIIGGGEDAGLSMPELFLRWAAFRDAVDNAQRTHASDLPSTFSMQRILGLTGIASPSSLGSLGSGPADLEPMPSLASALCDGPVCVPDSLSKFMQDYDVESRILSDSSFICRKELVVAAIVRDEQMQQQQRKAERPANATSVAQHHHGMLSFCVDLDEPPPGSAADQSAAQANASMPAVNADNADDEDIDDAAGYGGDSAAIIASWQDDGGHSVDNADVAAVASGEMSADTYDDEVLDGTESHVLVLEPLLPPPTLLLCYFDPAHLLSLL